MISISNSGPKGRFLSKEEGNELANRIRTFATGGGVTDVYIQSTWAGNIRWARNQIQTSGDIRANDVKIVRNIKGAVGEVTTNDLSDRRLDAEVKRAERLAQARRETPEFAFYKPYMEPYPNPTVWFDSTYGQTADARAEIARSLIKPVEEAGMVAAGYVEVSGQGRAVFKEGIPGHYFPYTWAQYTVTVRDPKGTASGWAGADSPDWNRIDGAKISAIALDKCLRSRNAVAIEPGRYTAILEPQAVGDLIAPMISALASRPNAEYPWAPPNPFRLEPGMPGYSKIGLKLIDERITISTDIMDPELSAPPFSYNGDVYNPVTWFENGVLKELGHDREYAVGHFLRNTGRPSFGGYRMSGGTATIESMIESTKRGVLVTRLDGGVVLDPESLLSNGVTRNGLWLIENGKISKPIRNFRYTESPLIALNNVLDLGVPQRIFSPYVPRIVPPLRINDFSFTALTDAI